MYEIFETIEFFFLKSLFIKTRQGPQPKTDGNFVITVNCFFTKEGTNFVNLDGSMSTAVQRLPLLTAARPWSSASNQIDIVNRSVNLLIPRCFAATTTRASLCFLPSRDEHRCSPRQQSKQTRT